MSRKPLIIEVHEVVLSADANAVDILATSSGLPKQRVKQAMTKGAVWLTRGRKTQRLRRARRHLKVSDELHLYYDEAVMTESPSTAKLIADVGGYSVWDKPYGMRSQGSKWGDHCTLARWAELHLEPQRTAFTVHRLDRAASGLMLVAHSKKVAALLSALFRQRQINKRYRATVIGDFSTQAAPCRVESELDGKLAISEFSFLESLPTGGQSVVDVSIETGRKHQIRRHLAELGFPIVGDRLYGTANVDSVDLQLVAYRLAFQCPVNDAPVDYRLSVTDPG